MDPALEKVPEGNWICQKCVAEKMDNKRRWRRTETETPLKRVHSILPAAPETVFSSAEGRRSCVSEGRGGSGIGSTYAECHTHT